MKLPILVYNYYALLFVSAATIALPLQANTHSLLNYGYFDIQAGSSAGTEVIGRINPKHNRFVTGNAESKEIAFSIIGGNGADFFSVTNQQDGFGHQFGVINASRDLPDKPTTYTLEIQYREGNQVTDTIELEIHSVESTQWESFSKNVLKTFTRESRMWGRVDVPDSEASRMIEYIIDHNGELPDQEYADPNDGWVSICNTIGGLSRNLVLNGKYGPDGTEQDRQLLRKALYLAYIKLYSILPVDSFSEDGTIDYSNRSHQWRYTDPLTGSAVFAHEEWLKDMHSDDRQLSTLATEAHEKLLQILNISWQAPSRNRPIPEDKVRYSGYWSDANRDHRMRTWMGLVSLMMDYNRPITFETHWYPYTKGEHAGFSLLPGWEPMGSFFDLQYWVQSNLRPSYFYWTTGRSSGYHPDGSISHHTGHGNDMAMFAYGYEWLTDKAIKLAGWFADTPWEITEPYWTQTAAYLTYTIPSIVYKNGYDMAFSGRSHNSPQLKEFGTKNLAQDLDAFLKGKPDSISLKKEPEIKQLIRDLESGSHERSINLPFWNGDAMIHRRGDAGETPYYMSVKMLSTRTRGAEGFGPDKYSYHMGDGMFQVKVRGDEYVGAQFDWDWHVLPGTTAEWRTDTLPMAKSTYDYPTGRNEFAGVVSNGKIGAAAFDFDRSEDPYSTVVAKKSYFYFDDFAVLTGSGIRRVHPGQGKTIITTVDQANWITDIHYSMDEAATQIIPLNSDNDIALKVTGPSWLHQGQTGYIIWPNPNSGFTQMVLRTGSKISDTDKGRSSKKAIFHIAIDHGTNPDPLVEHYVYAVVPNVEAEEMPKLVSLITIQTEVLIKDNDYHAVAHSQSKVIQASFFNPSSVTFATGLSVGTDHPSMVLLRDCGQQMEVALSEPEHRSDASQINLSVSGKLEPGSYAYDTAGVFRMQAEEVQVRPTNQGTKLTFELPDKTDAELYKNRHEMYYGMPALVTIPVK